jgi:hypothetical protein
MATCLLAITRAIKVSFPFYRINWKILNVVATFYGLVALTSAILQALDSITERNFKARLDAIEDTIETVEFSLLVSMYAIIVISNLVCVMMLIVDRAKDSPSKKHATVTVIIISICFLLFNTVYLVNYGRALDVFKTRSPTHNAKIRSPTTDAIAKYSQINYGWVIFDRLFLLLNSSLNPAIYLMRTSEMREWLSRLGQSILKLPSKFCTRENATGQGAPKRVRDNSAKTTVTMRLETIKRCPTDVLCE